MAPRLIGHGHHFKGMFKYAVLPLLIVGLAAGLLAPFVQWFRPAEANEAMFAPPAPIKANALLDTSSRFARSALASLGRKPMPASASWLQTISPRLVAR